MAKVLCAGVAVADFIFRVDEMPRKAEKYRALDAHISGGGNAANAAVAVSRLGGSALLAARIGADQVGNMILVDLKAAGVDCSLVNRADDGKSSFSSIYVDSDGERQIMNFRGSGLATDANWLASVPDINAVLVDNRWGPLTARGLEIAREKGVPGIVDVEAPVEPEYLVAATHLAFSRQGLSAFAPGVEIVDALEKARSVSGAWVCVTDGENGVHYIGDDSGGHIASFAVRSIDTLGAGDVWHAAFALKLAEGSGEGEAIRFASAAGALKCTRSGGRRSYPDRSEVDTYLEERQS